MTAPCQSEMLGRWRITEITGWDADYVDMLGPGHIQLDHDGGAMAFGVVQIGLECWYSQTSVHFTFDGSDEGTEVFGDGRRSRTGRHSHWENPLPPRRQHAIHRQTLVNFRSLLAHAAELTEIRTARQEQAAALAAARAGIIEQRFEIEALKARLAKLLRATFGRSSEKLRVRVEQLELTLADIDEMLAETAPSDEPADAEAAASTQRGDVRCPKHCHAIS